MRVYETVIVPAVPEREKEMLSHVECDLCGQESRKSWHTFKESSYDALEITVKMMKGNNYPEGGGGVVKEYDICPKCMESVVMGLLDDLITKRGGTVPAWTEWDW